MLFANDFQEWKLYVKQFRKVIKEMEESKKERALKRRQDLSALSRDLKAVAEAKAKGENATEKEDYFPVCHLFDIKQVHTITK